MKDQGIFAALRERATMRRRLEGYAFSALFHLLLLLLLATITLTSGGDGFGLGSHPPGAKVSLVVREDAVDDAELEDMVEDVEVKPLEVERIEQRPVSLPELSSYSMPRPSSERLASVQTKFSPTSGSVGGLSGQFGSFIGGLRKTGLDVVLVIDATASMQHVIDDIKEKAIRLVGKIQALVPIARVGVVAYRDHGEREEFTAIYTDLSFHASKIESWLGNLKADGGGDYEEAVRQGLETAMDEVSWRRRSKKVIILVGSSPPHKKDVPAINDLATEFAEGGGVISTIDVTQRMHAEYQRNLHRFLHGTELTEMPPLPDFYREVQASYRVIADHGGGELAVLGSSDELTQQILFFAFGSKWKNEVASYAKSH